MGAEASTTAVQEEPKVMFEYFPMGARGEVCRMTAKLGGVKLEEKDTEYDFSVMGTKNPAYLAPYGSSGGVPVLSHGTPLTQGSVKLSQNIAILSYIIDISPKYCNLTPAQKAKDLQYCGMIADLMDQGFAFFGAGDVKGVEGVMNRWYPLMESFVPTSGFVNGLSFPTAADFCIVVIRNSVSPYVGFHNLVGKNHWLDCPKMSALYDRIEAVPEVKQYLREGRTMKGNLFGFIETGVIESRGTQV